MELRIRNKVLKIKDCKGLRSVRGLMFDKMEKYDGALIYANNIWMPFVKYHLDLFFLDKNFRVLEQQKAVPMSINPATWKIYSCKKARYCLEVKEGLIKNIKNEKFVVISN